MGGMGGESQRQEGKGKQGGGGEKRGNKWGSGRREGRTKRGENP